MRLNLLDPPGVVPVKLVGKLHYLGPESVGVGKGSATNSFGQFLKKMIMINKLHRPANCWKSSLPFWIDEFLAAQRWLEKISAVIAVSKMSRSPWIARIKRNLTQPFSLNAILFSLCLWIAMNWYFMFAYMVQLYLFRQSHLFGHVCHFRFIGWFWAFTAQYAYRETAGQDTRPVTKNVRFRTFNRQSFFILW